jgi:hypothetical protein
MARVVEGVVVYVVCWGDGMNIGGGVGGDNGVFVEKR